MSAPMYLIVNKLGPKWKSDVPDSIQLRDHGRYMFGLHTRKVLKWAGPFAGGGAAVVVAESLGRAREAGPADAGAAEAAVRPVEAPPRPRARARPHPLKPTRRVTSGVAAD
jgi:hypothetical protein